MPAPTVVPATRAAAPSTDPGSCLSEEGLRLEKRRLGRVGGLAAAGGLGCCCSGASREARAAVMLGRRRRRRQRSAALPHQPAEPAAQLASHLRVAERVGGCADGGASMVATAAKHCAPGQAARESVTAEATTDRARNTINGQQARPVISGQAPAAADNAALWLLAPRP